MGVFESTQCAGKQRPTASYTFTWRLMETRDVIKKLSLDILNLYGRETEKGLKGDKQEKKQNKRAVEHS